jgi:hypothetical protein
MGRPAAPQAPKRFRQIIPHLFAIGMALPFFGRDLFGAVRVTAGSDENSILFGRAKSERILWM